MELVWFAQAKSQFAIKNIHVGAVLQQYQNGGWSPLSFYSKQLDSTQSKYSAFDRELLAT